MYKLLVPNLNNNVSEKKIILSKLIWVHFHVFQYLYIFHTKSIKMVDVFQKLTASNTFFNLVIHKIHILYYHTTHYI